MGGFILQIVIVLVVMICKAAKNTMGGVISFEAIFAAGRSLAIRRKPFQSEPGRAKSGFVQFEDIMLRSIEQEETGRMFTGFDESRVFG